jgi:RND family efflux transporter MFP subunit
MFYVAKWLRVNALVLMVLAPLLGMLPVGAQMLETPVGVDEVRREPLVQTIPVIGRLVSLQSGVVASRTAGLVEKFSVEVGDSVERGAVIAVLDQDRLRANKALREAELQEFQAQRAMQLAKEKLARQELDRLERLRNTAAFNQSLYDSRIQELAVASSNRREMEARMQRGRVKLAVAETELEYSMIRAPFPGTVTLRNTNLGAWVKQGDSVVTLVNQEALEIEADVPAARLAGVILGNRVTVMLDDGIAHQAQVRAIIPDENPAARTRPVRFQPQFDAVEIPLAINQPVTVLLPMGGESEVVSVHKDAVLRKGNQALVFVVQNGVAQPRSVELGEAMGSRLQVVQGLEPGEIVVIRGNERLRPGQQVSYPDQKTAQISGRKS